MCEGKTETCRFVGRRAHHVRPAARRVAVKGEADSSGGGGGGGNGKEGGGRQSSREGERPRVQNC